MSLTSPAGSQAREALDRYNRASGAIEIRETGSGFGTQFDAMRELLE